MRAILLLLPALLLIGAERPDFSGTWRLDTTQSDFGRLPAPQEMTTRVEHSEPGIRVRSTTTTVQGTSNSAYTYRTDSSEQTNTVGGVRMVSRARWIEHALVVEVTAQAARGDLHFTDEWRLTDGNKTLTITRTIHAPSGDVKQIFVFRREGA